MEGVTGAVVVAILYLSRRCDVWMYRSCAGVVTSGLPLRGRSAVSLLLGQSLIVNEIANFSKSYLDC